MEGKKITSLSDLYTNFPSVQIEEGTFKYILIKVSNPPTDESVLFLRGTKRFEYHKEIFEDFESKLRNHLEVRGITLGDSSSKLKETVEIKCPGGGRIEHSAKNKTMSVYGYSMSYGVGDHATAIKMLIEAYPSYDAANFIIGTKEY